MTVTIKKIAKEAGVSVTTVSNVINNKTHRVSDQKRELIQSIIDKYNYLPNMNARALVQSSSRLIGLLYYSDKKRLDFTDPFVAEILEGIEGVAKSTGFFTLIHNSNTKQDIIDIQKNWKFDGLIAVGFRQELFEEIDKSINVPIVFIDTHIDERIYSNLENHPNRYFVNTDDFGEGYRAAKYLIENKHEKIAFLCYEFDLNEASVVQQRYIGYISALKENKISISEQLTYSQEDFDKMLAEIDSYTAVIVSADFLAIQFIGYLKRNQAFYENKISVIGFDDIKYSELNDPPLTTIRLEQLEKGKLAMEMLVDIVVHKKKKQQLTFLKGKLMTRDTVSNPQNKGEENGKEC